MSVKTVPNKTYVTSSEEGHPFTVRDLKRFLEHSGLSDDAAIMLQGVDGDEIEIATFISIPNWDMAVIQMDPEEYDFDEEGIDREDEDPISSNVKVLPEDCSSCIDYEKGDDENDILDAVVA